MGKFFKTLISLIVIAMMVFFAYLIVIEKKSFSEIVQSGKETVEDKSLEFKVSNLISMHKSFENCDIDIKAEEGVVTLSGLVDSLEKANLAATLVDSIKGVDRVINKIKVSSELSEISEDGRTVTEKMLDDELKEKAEAVLGTRDDLSGSEIRVTVFKRVAFLDGKVISEMQKNRAVQLVRVIEQIKDVQFDLKMKYE